ncbi:MAG: hypothetical protein H6Q15_2340 [Bacteroidetes bacterium]|nr:hypothetical protein [Bacteroidota bacterium]
MDKESKRKKEELKNRLKRLNRHSKIFNQKQKIKLCDINHIIIAICVFIIGVSISIFLLSENAKSNGTSATLIMSFLVFSYGYFQFEQNRKEAEKKRIINLKLNAYREIMGKCDAITQDSYSICFEYITNEKDGYSPNVILQRMILDQKIRSLNIIIDYYQSIIKINIKTEHYKHFIGLVNIIALSQDNSVFNEEIISSLVQLKVDLDCSLISTFK